MEIYPKCEAVIIYLCIMEQIKVGYLLKDDCVQYLFRKMMTELRPLIFAIQHILV